MAKRVQSKTSRSRGILFAISVLVMPLLLVLAVEFGQRGSFSAVAAWGWKYPGNLALSLLLAYALYTLVSFLTASPAIPFVLVFLPLAIAGIAGGIKIQYRETPVLPWNAVILKEIGSVLKLIGENAVIAIAGAALLVVLVILTAATYRRFRVRMSGRRRLACLLISGAVLAATVIPLTRADYHGDILAFYMRRGWLPATIIQLNRPLMEQPADYSAEATAQVLDGLKTETETEMEGRQASDQDRPDLIVVMLEAFSDPVRMLNLTFDQDPISNYRTLAEKAISGNLSVNAYGGNTSCTEFEFLTGLSSTFAAPEITGYMEILRQPVPNMAESLGRAGYTCAAVHPFYPETLNREKTFAMFGFSSFYDITDFKKPDDGKPYTSDETTGDKIISLYDRHRADDPDDPLFLFTVTIQNHFDYKLSWYGADPAVRVTIPDTIGSKAADMLNGYIQGTYDSDRLIGRLVSFFSDVDRPVILVFFGDHLPGMAGGMETYHAAGLLSDMPRDVLSDHGMSSLASAEDIIRMHTTPFLIWDNYREERKTYDILSPGYLQALLVTHYGLPLGEVADFLTGIMSEAPNTGLSNWPDTVRVPESSALQSFRNLQYYLLHDRQPAVTP